MLESIAKQRTHHVTGHPENEHNDASKLGCGWIACTSDELFSTKPSLFDIKAELPPRRAGTVPQVSWPKVTDSATGIVKATQRDLRRYKAMRAAFSSLQRDRSIDPITSGSDTGTDDEQATLLPKTKPKKIHESGVPQEDEIVEPVPWAAIAYNSLMWWASAGERTTELDEEHEEDGRFVDTVINAESDKLEVAMTAYFHHLTSSIFRPILHLSDTATSDAAVDGSDRVFVSKEDLASMGLDVWSKADREFVRSLVKVYCHRDADVQGASIECCGVTVL